MPPAQQSPAVAVADEAAVLTKAAVRAAERLKLPNKVLADVLGLSEATISRMTKGQYSLDRGEKAFELAAIFARLYRSLDAIVGGDDAVARAWLRNPNTAFDAIPMERIQTVQGLIDVVEYLDSRRALV